MIHAPELPKGGGHPPSLKAAYRGTIRRLATQPSRAPPPTRLCPAGGSWGKQPKGPGSGIRFGFAEEKGGQFQKKTREAGKNPPPGAGCIGFGVEVEVNRKIMNRGGQFHFEVAPIWDGAKNDCGFRLFYWSF